MLAERPFADEQALLHSSDDAIAALAPADLDDALAGHPRIGDRERARQGASSREQPGTIDDTVRGELAVANAEYEQRFGYVYLVCATGRSAEQLLADCRARLGNDPLTERRVMVRELAEITKLRLSRVLRGEL